MEWHEVRVLDDEWPAWLVRDLEGARLEDQRLGDLEKRQAGGPVGVGTDCADLHTYINAHKTAPSIEKACRNQMDRMTLFLITQVLVHWVNGR